MGCYNTTGFVSGLNVRCSDPIVAIPCVIEGSGKYNPNNYYTTSQLRPISLPLFGKYDDYGSIEDIEDTPSSRAWKMSVCEDIEGCMKIFERSNNFCTELSKVLDREKDYIKDDYDNIKNGLLRVLSPTDEFCLIIEHRKVYEELIADKTEKVKGFFNDFISFYKLLFDANHGGFPSYFDDRPFIPFGLRMAITAAKREGQFKEELKTLVEESKRLDDKWRYHSLQEFFFNWHSGFDAYSKDDLNNGTILSIDGIADAFSDFSTFDTNIMRLNIGYRVPSCNCGGQEDFNRNVIKFYNFLSDFYDNNLKEEDYVDEDWEDDENN